MSTCTDLRGAGVDAEEASRVGAGAGAGGAMRGSARGLCLYLRPSRDDADASAGAQPRAGGDAVCRPDDAAARGTRAVGMRNRLL